MTYAPLTLLSSGCQYVVVLTYGFVSICCVGDDGFQAEIILAEVQAPSAVCGSRWDQLAPRVLSCPIDFRLLSRDRINVVIVM